MTKLEIGDIVLTPEGKTLEVILVRKLSFDNFKYVLSNEDFFCQDEVDDGTYKLANDSQLRFVTDLETKERVERVIATWLYEKGYKNAVAMSGKFGNIENFTGNCCIKASDYYACKKEFALILEDYFKIFAS